MIDLSIVHALDSSLFGSLCELLAHGIKVTIRMSIKTGNDIPDAVMGHGSARSSRSSPTFLLSDVAGHEPDDRNACMSVVVEGTACVVRVEANRTCM